MELKIKEKLKFIFKTDDPQEVDPDKEPSLGHLMIKSLEDLDSMSYEVLEGIESQYDKECFPERSSLEANSQFKDTLNEI